MFAYFHTHELQYRTSLWSHYDVSRYQAVMSTEGSASSSATNTLPPPPGTPTAASCSTHWRPPPPFHLLFTPAHAHIFVKWEPSPVWRALISAHRASICVPPPVSCSQIMALTIAARLAANNTNTSTTYSPRTSGTQWPALEHRLQMLVTSMKEKCCISI